MRSDRQYWAYVRLSAAVGSLGIVGNHDVVHEIVLRPGSRAAFRRHVRSIYGEIPEDPSRFAPIIRQLRRYFSGRRTDFVFQTSLGWATPFEKRVYRALMRVGYGATIGYGELARRAGSPGASRAVGRAMARNRLPILIPCHRVINADGSLGGFSAGLALKTTLLHFENHVRLL